MSQLAESVSQPRLGGGGAGHSLRRLKTARFYENGWQEPYESRGSRAVVCPGKAGMFSRSQSCQGKNQEPCSLDGRYEGNRLSEAHRQSCLWDSKRVTGP
jgi:hypothetical protein